MILNLHQITSIDNCIDSLHEVTIFSILAANSKYWKIEIAGNCTDKTTLRPHQYLLFIRITGITIVLKTALWGVPTSN